MDTKLMKKSTSWILCLVILESIVALPFIAATGFIPHLISESRSEMRLILAALSLIVFVGCQSALIWQQLKNKKGIPYRTFGYLTLTPILITALWLTNMLREELLPYLVD